MTARIYAEIVNGKCPTCSRVHNVSRYLTNDYYRCMNCGADLQQHINGKISYIPTMTSRAEGKLYIKEWLE